MCMCEHSACTLVMCEWVLWLGHTCLFLLNHFARHSGNSFCTSYGTGSSHANLQEHSTPCLGTISRKRFWEFKCSMDVILRWGADNGIWSSRTGDRLSFRVAGQDLGGIRWVGMGLWGGSGDILEVLQMLGEEKGSNVVGSQNVNLTQISLTYWKFLVSPKTEIYVDHLFES